MYQRKRWKRLQRQRWRLKTQESGGVGKCFIHALISTDSAYLNAIETDELIRKCSVITLQEEEEDKKLFLRAVWKKKELISLQAA